MHEHSWEERGDPWRPAASRVDHEALRTTESPVAERPAPGDAESVLGLQRSVGNAAVVQLLEDERSPVHDVINSAGRPLDSVVRMDMEARLGHDFSDVRVHDNDAAAASAAAVSAHAYTVGNNMVFQRNVYDPSSHAGRVTLAHELTHVIQQRSGPVDGTAVAGGISLSDPSDRFEREASSTAEQVMAGPAPVQRDELDDELPE